MFLSWLNVVTQTIAETLWYLEVYPPPPTLLKIAQNSASIKVKSAPSDENPPKSGPLPSLPPEATTIQSAPPSLFALIIGVNKYHDSAITNLHGAVPDADAVRDFLTSEVGVAKDRIVNLRDEGATREAMVKAIQNLAHNPAITLQDPILIYYAGHGAEASPPHANWHTNNTNGMLQMLVPHDFVTEGSNGYQGQGIFDVTLSKLLADVAKNKSDNITVIFDSCHSGSGTREVDRHETFVERGIKLSPNYTIPANVIDGEERASCIVARYEKSGLRSHVLLAACKQEQTAKERQGRGVFTSALLTLLREEGVDQLTYKDIITRIPDLPDQNPQCEGTKEDHILFQSKVTRPLRISYRIAATANKPGEYTLEAGEAHGVTNKAEFAVYSDKKVSSLVGHVEASRTTPFKTQCSVAVGVTPFSLSQPGYAVQTRVGEGHDLRLFIEKDDAFLGLFMQLVKEMHRNDEKKRSFRLLDDASEEADLAISTHDGLVQFHVREKICRQYGLTSMPFDDIRVDDSDYLLTILRSAADFYWNLHHSNKGGKILSQKITFECLKLVPSGQINDDLEDILIPEPGGQNLNVGGTIIINLDERFEYSCIDGPDRVLYGYRVTNKSSVPLYAALFYFDIGALAIEDYYLPATAAKGQAEFSLPANGALTIGFGDSGTGPRSYFLRENQKVDVGFLKLYVSTEYVDYSAIIQASPFNRDRASGPPPPRCRNLWDSLIIPMVQRERPEPKL